MQFLYTGRMDPECLPLCDALNSIPGIQTLESCCGHGKQGFRIWFKLTSPCRNLTIVGRVFDRRYGGLEGWVCNLDNTDNPEACPIFLIGSGTIVGPVAYEQANKIAENLKAHMTHPEFVRIFGIILP